MVHRLKDPYLVQHVGGAVVAVEGGDDCALADNLDGQSGTLKSSLISLQAPFSSTLLTVYLVVNLEGTCQCCGDM